MATLKEIISRLAALTRYPTAADWELYYVKGASNAWSCGGGVIVVSQELYRQHSTNRAILSFILAHEMTHDLNPLVVLSTEAPSNWVEEGLQNRDKTVREKRSERYADTGGVMLLSAAGMDRAAGVTWLKAQTGTVRRVLGFLFSVPFFDEHGRLSGTLANYYGFDHGTYPERLEWMQAAVNASWRTSSRPQPYFVGLNEDLTYDQAMISRYEASGRAAKVGYPFDRNSSIFVHGWGGLLIQDFLEEDGESGAIIRKEGGAAAWWVHGAIWATFASRGGPATFGAPLEEEKDHPDGSGDRYQHFEKATFLWHKATNVTEVLPRDWQPPQPSSGGGTTGTTTGRPPEQPGTRAGQEMVGPAGIKLVWVPGGSFMMGSNDGYGDEKPVHRVELSGFWIGRTEVTVAQWRSVMGNVPTGQQGDNHPVVDVSWDDAKQFCVKLGLQLPTEAQWEYAARGPNSRDYPWGNDWNDAKCCFWANRGPGGGTFPVGSFPSGASWCGALDMAGNVWEWCADWYDSNYYASSPGKNPPGPSSGDWRVLRGGSWGDTPDYCRSASRNSYGPAGGCYFCRGFRVARS